MAQAGRKKLQFDPGPLIQALGLEEVVRRMIILAGGPVAALKRLVEIVGWERVFAEIGVDRLVAALTPEQVAEYIQRRLSARARPRPEDADEPCAVVWAPGGKNRSPA